MTAAAVQVPWGRYGNYAIDDNAQIRDDPADPVFGEASALADQPEIDEKPPVLRGVVTDEQVQAMRERNEARATAAKRDMGPLYCCHPAHSPARRQR